MKRFLAAAIVLFLAAQGSKVSLAETQEDRIKTNPFYAEILKAEAKKTPGEMLQFFDESIREDGERIAPVGLWLSHHTLEQKDASKVDALYFMSYSDVMLQNAGAYKEAGKPEEFLTLLKSSLLGLYIYELMASADAKRCADKSVLMPLRMETLAERLDALKSAYALLPQASFDQFAQLALVFEEKFAARPPNKFICSLGKDKAADLLKQKGVKKTEVQDESGAKRTELTPPPGYEYKPKFISDTEWNAKRAEIRDNIVKSWAQRYQTLSKADTP